MPSRRFLHFGISSLFACSAVWSALPGHACASPLATGATEVVLYDFMGGKDGNGPFAGAIADKNGVLYGTTSGGGGSGCSGVGCGAVYKLTPPATGHTQWTETVLYRFKGGSDGDTPRAGLIMDSSGALYGTTSGLFGGQGTVFKLAPPAPGRTQWTETVLYSFKGGSDGSAPLGSLIMDSEGALYGTTSGFSNHTSGNNGTVFKLTPPTPGHTQWTETVLYGFKGGSDGANPPARLTFDNKGALYGTTSGTVFKLTPPAAGHTQWTKTTLYSFKGGSDGTAPMAGVTVDSKGTLYSTTSQGGVFSSGTVFKLTPPAKGHTQWIETVLHSFGKSIADGRAPQGGLAINTTGELFGTTSFNGSLGRGTVFKLTPPCPRARNGTETVLSSLSGGGAEPLSDPLLCLAKKGQTQAPSL